MCHVVSGQSPWPVTKSSKTEKEQSCSGSRTLTQLSTQRNWLRMQNVLHPSKVALLKSRLLEVTACVLVFSLFLVFSWSNSFIDWPESPLTVLPGPYHWLIKNKADTLWHGGQAFQTSLHITLLFSIDYFNSVGCSQSPWTCFKQFEERRGVWLLHIFQRPTQWETTGKNKCFMISIWKGLVTRVPHCRHAKHFSF
jgi:hypothetical protein